jgi:Uma2 family endonuclease
MPAISYKPRYTVADYITWEGDWELWDGTPVSMSPSPNYRHQRVGARLVRSLEAQLEKDEACHDCHLAYEVDWHIDEYTIVRPDLLIVCGPEPEDFVKTPPALVVEILSPSTAEKDRTAKRELYASQGVPHYLIIDPDSLAITHLTPENERGAPLTTGTELLLHGTCRIMIDPASLT